jgi:HK97 family phage portal protein
VLHIKGFSLDGYMGISPIGVARNNLGAARAAERASTAVFRNGMRPSGIATSPDYLTEEQREQAKVMLANYQGAMNTGKVPLLEGGWKFEPLTIPPNDAQMLETQSFHVEVICRWFDVPPIMIGHMDKSTTLGSSTEQVMGHFYKTCLRGHLKRIEQASPRFSRPMTLGRASTPSSTSRDCCAPIALVAPRTTARWSRTDS